MPDPVRPAAARLPVHRARHASPAAKTSSRAARAWGHAWRAAVWCACLGGVSSVALAFGPVPSSAPAASAAQGPGQHPGQAEGLERLPERRAQALWRDARWLAFQQGVLSAFQARCEVPAADDTWVKVAKPAALPPGSPAGSSDFVSDHPEVRLNCQGRDGLVAVRVRAEFVRMMDSPLNLELSLQFKR